MFVIKNITCKFSFQLWFYVDVTHGFFFNVFYYLLYAAVSPLTIASECGMDTMSLLGTIQRSVYQQVYCVPWKYLVRSTQHFMKLQKYKFKHCIFKLYYLLGDKIQCNKVEFRACLFQYLNANIDDSKFEYKFKMSIHFCSRSL